MVLKNYARKNQRGMTLIEVIVAIAIGMILLGVIAGGYSTYLTYQTNQITAEWLKVWQVGAKQWMSDNSASLTASSGGTATYAQLNPGGYFGTGFSQTNSYNETATLKVIIGAGGKLQGLICASGGQPPTGLQQRQIAGMVGLAGGWVLSTAPSVAVGKSWGPVPLSTYGLASGSCQLVVALFVSDLASVTVDDYLHRSSTSGHPEFNQMATAIDLNKNALNNVSQMTMPAGGDAINIAGNTIYGDSQNMAFRPNSGNVFFQSSTGVLGNIVSVNNITGTGTFTAQQLTSNGNAHVAGQLDAGGQIISNSNILAAGNVYGNQGVYASNVWAGVDTSGTPNGSSAWLLTGGTSGWRNLTYGGGWYMSDTTWLRSYNDKNIYTGGTILAGAINSNGNIAAAGAITASGAITSNGRLTTNEYLQIVGHGAPGQGCGPNGLVATDGSGNLISCANGIWSGNPANGQYYDMGLYINQVYYGSNSSGHTMFVLAYSSGYNCGSTNNAYGATAVVNGFQVATDINYNTSYYKTATMTFPVQSGASYYITYTNNGCNTQTRISEYR